MQLQLAIIKKNNKERKQVVITAINTFNEGFTATVESSTVPRPGRRVTVQAPTRFLDTLHHFSMPRSGAASAAELSYYEGIYFRK